MCPCICSAVSFSTAGSRQPLLVRMCRCVCTVTLVFRLFVLPCTMANHGGLTPPALVLVYGRLPAKKTIFAVHKRTFDQERRASARRGRQYEPCAGRIADRAATNEQTTKSGGRQPAVVRATFWHRKTNASCVASVRIKSGGRQPAVGGEMRIGRHERRSSADRRRCVWIAVAVAGIGATGLT
jgi:hypothetical protein